MLIKKMIEFIAKRLYKEKYIKLKEKLMIEFEYLKTNPNDNFNTLSKLLISGEDHRFYYHLGFDTIAICRALRNRLIYNRIEGASTIEQQLVRVLMNDFEKTYKRRCCRRSCKGKRGPCPETDRWLCFKSRTDL